MVRPQEIIDAIIFSLQETPEVTNSATYVGYEPDIDSESIKLPLIEVSTGPMVPVSDENTDFIGFKTDENGNRTARIYESLYTFEVTVAVWTAHGSKYSPRKIGNSVRDALYEHEIAGPGLPLIHPDTGKLNDVWNFALQEGSQADDLTTSPTLRRWQQQLTISASEQYITEPDESTISGFNLN